MQWTARGGFTSGTPWLPMIDPERCNVEDQRGVAGSTLEQYRALIRLRRLLSGPVEVTAADAGYLSYRRGDTVVDLNLGDRPREVSQVGEVLYSTRLWSGDGRLDPAARWSRSPGVSCDGGRRRSCRTRRREGTTGAPSDL
jgi:alpha-glucosidase